MSSEAGTTAGAAESPAGTDDIGVIGVDLSGVDLSGVDLSGVDLSGLTLRQLDGVGRSSLDLALMRVLAPADDGSDDPVVGFQSAI
jgi:FXSXX-COOH protein